MIKLNGKTTVSTISVAISDSPRVSELADTLNAALSIRTRLLEIGPYVNTVQQDMSRLAEYIQQYWRSLDQLSHRLNSSTAVHNGIALSLIQIILSSTQTVFTTIENHLPSRNIDSVTFQLLAKQKMKRMWKKVSVNDLLRRLDVLDSVVQLMVLALTIGEKVNWCRAFVRGCNNKKVVFETLKLQDKHARTYLAEQVLLTSRILADQDYGILTHMPTCLTQVTLDLSQAHEGWDESVYASRNVRTWWDSLLHEWTKIY